MARFGPVLVTGWSTYVGQAVIRAADRQDIPVTLLLDDATHAVAARQHNCAVRIASPHDVVATSRAVRGHEAVIHIETVLDTVGAGDELLRTATILAALDDGAALVMPGHAAMFGSSDQYPGRPSALQAPPYLRRVARLADLVRVAAAAKRRAFGCFSAFVLGWESGRITRDWLAASMRHGAVSHWDSPAQWSGVHVDDWAALLLGIGSKGAPGEWPLFAHGQRINVADVAQAIAGATGLPLAPAGARQSANAWHGALARDQLWPSDIETEILGWRPLHFDLDVAIHALCAQGRA